MSPPRRGPELATPGARQALTYADDGTTSAASREALQRVHAVRTVLDAVEAGAWPLEVGIVDGAVAVLRGVA